jgi:hypothetical protein
VNLVELVYQALKDHKAIKVLLVQVVHQGLLVTVAYLVYQANGVIEEMLVNLVNHFVILMEIKVSQDLKGCLVYLEKEVEIIFFF